MATYIFAPLIECPEKTEIHPLPRRILLHDEGWEREFWALRATGGSLRRHHPALLIKGKRHIEVDENIAPLIAALWDAGIDTSNSCEDLGGKGNVWITFPTGVELDAFSALGTGLSWVVCRGGSAGRSIFSVEFPQAEYANLLSAAQKLCRTQGEINED